MLHLLAPPPFHFKYLESAAQDTGLEKDRRLRASAPAWCPTWQQALHQAEQGLGAAPRSVGPKGDGQVGYRVPSPSITACWVFAAGLREVGPEHSPEDRNGARPRADCRALSTGDELTPMAGRGLCWEGKEPHCSEGLQSVLKEVESQEGVRLDAAGMRA